MKTVMKKMFCLMLVAVLMVGVMPFQASAATNVPYRVMVNGVVVGSPVSSAGETSLNVLNQFLTTEQLDPSKYTVVWNDHYTNSTVSPNGSGIIAVKSVTDFGADSGYPADWIHHFEAIVTPVSTTCGNCNKSYNVVDGHVCCEYCKEGHAKENCTNLCTLCPTPTLKNPNHVHCALCNGLNGAHDDNCDNNPYKVKTCIKCNNTYKDIDGAHVCCDRCKELHATANCPYCTTCWAKGDKVTTHATSAHCTTCNGINGHLSGYPCYTAPATGSANLYVWANLYTGSIKTGTVLLDTITGLSGSEHIYQVVANNDGRIRSKIPAGYSWTGHVYYEQDPKTTLTVPSTLSVASEDDAVINLYTTQKLVVARVHTNKSYAIDHTINIDGFKIGDTVTSNDVLKAVKNHYNVSSLKMYTPAEWEKVVTGKTGTVIPNYEVHEGDNIIDVYVTGTYKTSSGTTYKADSTNPKTGDMIFAPAMVLGLSASALAVLFYLNKKRAY